MKKILVIVLSLFASGACAQWQVPNHSVPIGRGSGSGFKNVPPASAGTFLGGAGASADPTMRALVPSDLPSPPNVITSTATGSPNTFVITPSYIPTGVTTIQNGMKFSFMAPFATTIAAGYVNVSIPALSVVTVPMVQPDGYTWTYVGDVQLGQLITLQYVTNVGFVVIYPSSATANGFIAAIGSGNVTLAASDANTIVLNGAFGGAGAAMVQWNSASAQYRLIKVQQQAAYIQNLFNNTANVEGVLNQTLANNTIYAVALNPQDGTLGYTATSPIAPALSFWRLSAGWYHTSGPEGVEVLCNSGVCHSEYPYLGLVYTRVADITNYIAPADAPMGSAVYSHYNSGREKFGYQTVVHSNTITGTSYAVQTLPSVGSVTGALNNGPSFIALTTVSCTTDARTVSSVISLSGEGYVSGSGGSFTVVSQEATVYLPTANKPGQLVNYFETAPADGTMTGKISIKVDGGTCTFATQITGSIPQ